MSVTTQNDHDEQPWNGRRERDKEDWTRIVIASVLATLLTALLGWINLGRDLVTREEMHATMEQRFDYRFQRLEGQMEAVQQSLARIEGRLHQPER